MNVLKGIGINKGNEFKTSNAIHYAIAFSDPGDGDFFNLLKSEIILCQILLVQAQPPPQPQAKFSYSKEKIAP